MQTLLRIALLFTIAAVGHAQQAPTGDLRLEYTSRDVVGDQFAQALSAAIEPNEMLQWRVYIPTTYDRGRPPGVFVFIDPDGGGSMPDAYRAVFDRQNMIWVGAQTGRSGASPIKLVWQAILAYRAIEKDYAIDLNRLYVGSAADSAFIAVNVLATANEFAGGIYLRGSYFWGEQEVASIDNVRRKHHVFITGTNDPAKVQVRNDYGRFRDDGVANARLIYDTRRLQDPPQPEHFEEALAFLDARLSR